MQKTEMQCRFAQIRLFIFGFDGKGQADSADWKRKGFKIYKDVGKISLPCHPLSLCFFHHTIVADENIAWHV